MVLNNTPIHQYQLLVDFKKLSNEVDYNISLDSRVTRESTHRTPGTQSFVVIRGGLIETVSNHIASIIRNDLYSNDNITYVMNNWIYVSDKNDKGSSYHNHTHMVDLNSRGEWAWVYYVSLPENDEGNILFKVNNNEISYTPKLGDILIFPAELMHVPTSNPNSNIKRKVIVGTFSQINFKDKKTLI